MGTIVGWMSGLPGLSGFANWVTSFPSWAILLFIWGFPVLMLAGAWLVILATTGPPPTATPVAAPVKAEPPRATVFAAAPVPDEMSTDSWPVPAELVSRGDREWERTSRDHLWVAPPLNGAKYHA